MRFSFPLRIYFLAVLLRLIPVFLTRGLGIGLDDMFQYDMLARSLASGHGFRWYAQADLKMLEPYVDFDLSTATGYDPQSGVYTSFRAPLYPAFLAIIYSFSGLEFSRFFAARLVQAILLGAPLAPLTYFAAKHFFLLSSNSIEEGGNNNDTIARLSAWFVACYPILIVYPVGLGTENLFFVLLLSSFLFLLKSLHTPTKLNLFFSGLLLALTALTRSVILPFALLAILFLFYLHGRKVLVAAAVCYLIVTFWGVRNTLLHGRLTGIETSLGYNLYLGYHPGGNGSFIFGPSLDLLPIMDDYERSMVGRQKALEFIREAPERVISLALNRLGFFFGLEKRALMYFYSNNLLGYVPPPIVAAISVILLLPFVFLSVFAALGLGSLPWSRQTILLGLLLLAYTLPHVLILAEDRFHLALVPYFAILASYAVTLLRQRRLLTTSGKGIFFAGGLILLLLLGWGLEIFRDADKLIAILGPNGNQTHFPY